MEIGGLGFINGLASTLQSNEVDVKVATGKFKGLFAQMAGGSKGSSVQPSVSENNEAIDALVQFLKVEDILDIDGGLQMLKNLMASDTDALNFVNESLTSDKTIGELIQSLLAKLPSDSFNNGHSAEINQFDSSKTPLEQLLELMSLLGQMDNLNLHELKGMLGDDLQELLKAAKYIQLLDEKILSGQQKKQFMQVLDKLADKLEQMASNHSLAEQNKQASRLEYLQNTFSKVAQELNSQQKGPFQPSIPLQETQVVKLEGANGQAFVPQLSRGEQFTLTLATSSKEVNTADLIKQFENILARSQFSQTGGTQKLLIKLYPEHLGSLRIELIQRDATMVARILTTTQAAKEALESQLTGLKQSFQSQNIQVERIEINQQFQERYLGREQQSNESSQQEQRHNKRQSEETVEGEGFTSTLEEAVVNMEA